MATAHADDAENPINHALVIGASGGVGAGFVEALGQQNVSVTTLSRSADGFDLADANSIEKTAKRFADIGATFDLIVIASGILDVRQPDGEVAGPEKSFRDLESDNAMTAFAVNALGPALVFKHFAALMPARQRAVFVALSARVGSIGDNGLGGWMSYRASKAALNQFIRCASIEHTRRHKDHLVIAMHPGTLPTALTEKYAKGRYTDDPMDAANRMLTVIRSLTPAQTGHFFAYDGTQIVW
ncbi:MAG: SDR family NAD(P)-dependent oxidoreductase [Pseudomonadota bacterium]